MMDASLGRMSLSQNVESLGPPRGPTGRYRIDMDKLLSLHAQGYSPRQIAKALGVGDYTVRSRLRERFNIPIDPHFAELGRKGQRAQKRTVRRRKREAKAEAGRQAAEREAETVMRELTQIALISLAARGEGTGPR